MNPHWNRKPEVAVGVADGLQTVAVYGTLKKGGRLHGHMDGARFIGHTLIKDYLMLDMGAFPGVIYGHGFKVVAELWECTWEKIFNLDRVEGHPNLFTRTRIQTFKGPTWMYTREEKGLKLMQYKWLPHGYWPASTDDGERASIPWTGWEDARKHVMGTSGTIISILRQKRLEQRAENIKAGRPEDEGIEPISSLSGTVVGIRSEPTTPPILDLTKEMAKAVEKKEEVPTLPDQGLSHWEIADDNPIIGPGMEYG